MADEAVMHVLTEGLGGGFTGQKVLMLIPDHTRSLPLPELFRAVEVLHNTRTCCWLWGIDYHRRRPTD